MSSDCFVIAVDGPAGVGKSTTSKRLAEHLGFAYVDSGALYRCVAVAALEAKVALDDEDALGALVQGLDVEAFGDGLRFRLNGREVTQQLRTQQVSDAASRTSACPAVRRALVDWQRNAVAPPGAVVEGRDIGTVIFPDADLKVFLNAEPSERARRRAAETEADPAGERIRGVAREIAERDKRDSTRKVAPLKAAPDAVVIDSTNLDLEAVVAAILREVERRRARN